MPFLPARPGPMSRLRSGRRPRSARRVQPAPASGLTVGVVAGPAGARFIGCCVALAVSAIAQHAQPVDLSQPGARTRVRIALELALTLLAVITTGGGRSPFVLTPMPVMALA